MIVMRGYVGDLVFYFDTEGHAVGLELYREWEKNFYPIKLKPGEERKLI